MKLSDRKRKILQLVVDDYISTAQPVSSKSLTEKYLIFILPSLWEGLGIALIEAQAAGLPCLGSEFIPAEVAVTDLYARLPLNDVQQWTNAILHFQTDRKDTYEQIKKAGYDISATSSYLQGYYQNLAK